METGEYDHPFHVMLHRAVMNIIYEVSIKFPENTIEELRVFDLNGENLDDKIRVHRIDLLERIYKRNASFWKQINTAGTKKIELPTKFSEKLYHDICWP